MSSGVLDVDDVESSWKLLTVSDDSDTTDVTSSCDHGEVSWLELDKVGDLSSRDIDDNGIVDLNFLSIIRLLKKYS